MSTSCVTFYSRSSISFRAVLFRWQQDLYRKVIRIHIEGDRLVINVPVICMWFDLKFKKCIWKTFWMQKDSFRHLNTIETSKSTNSQWALAKAWCAIKQRLSWILGIWTDFGLFPSFQFSNPKICMILFSSWFRY